MINLLLAGNDKVYKGMLIALLSITKYNHDPLNVYILTMDLKEENPNYFSVTDKHFEILNDVVKKANKDSKVIKVDTRDVYLKTFGAFNKNGENIYTPYTLLRLIIDQFEQIPSKILYIDTDVMANRDIKPLFDIDISEYELAAVKDYLGKIFIGPRYFNAGVLLLNIDMIKKTGLFKKCINLLVTKKLAFADQDALNKNVLKVKYLPRIYNEQRRYYKKTVIQHFCKSIRLLPIFHTINVKPWDVKNIHKKHHNHHYDDILNEYLRIEEENK